MYSYPCNNAYTALIITSIVMYNTHTYNDVYSEYFSLEKDRPQDMILCLNHAFL